MASERVGTGVTGLRAALYVGAAIGAAWAWGCSDEQSAPAGTGGSGTGGGAGLAGGTGGSGATGGAGGSAATCELDLPVVVADLWVAPNGSAGATGSEADPLDLATALSSSSPAAPGDTIVVAGGTYPGEFSAGLVGTAEAPIVVRAARGERVILDGGSSAGTTLTVAGAYTHIVGFEVLSSDSMRETTLTGSSPADLTLPGGITVTGPGTKIINCTVHDTAQGISFWTPAIDAEIYGTIIFNNGWEAPDRGHGHAIYTQNAEGTKRIAANILFFGFGYGVHAYTEGGSIQGFDFEDNVWFQSGASTPGDDLSTNCLVGGLQPVARLALRRNLGWVDDVAEGSVRLGYSDSAANEDATLEGNTFVGATTFSSTWSSVTMTDNTFVGELTGIDPGSYPANQYLASLPSGPQVFIVPNAYDPERAHLTIVNPDQAASVEVDLTGTVDVGAPFAMASVMDLHGEPVVSGVFDGLPVGVPMGTKPAVQPHGLEGAVVAAEDPGPAFGAFVLHHTRCLR